MVLSRAQCAAIMTHILENVFDEDPDSDLHKSMKHNGIKSPIDLCSEDEDQLDNYEYPTATAGVNAKLTRGNIGLLKSFKRFVAYKTATGQPIDDDGWLLITKQEFDEFRIGVNNPPPPIIASARPPLPQPDPVREFRRGIKRDATQFISFKDDAAWDNWNRSTIAQARAQDVEEVLDPSYLPTTSDEISLFGEKQKYMYAVFEKTLLTDKGKALVRFYQKTYDAQSIYRELQQYALQSTKANMDASGLLAYITTSNLGDGKWRGTTHAYILHWQDQVRKYHDLKPNQVLSNDILCTMLENAVHPINELRAVKIQADQQKVHTKQDLTYEEYCALLLSAAQQHDQKLTRASAKAPKRHIYAHDVIDDAYEDGESFVDTSTYDIDCPVDTIEVNATNFFKGPRLTSEQWHKLPDDAKKIWDMLSQEAKAIILRPPSSSTSYPNNGWRPFPPKFNKNFQQKPRQVNEHDIEMLMACLHDLHGGSQPSNTDEIEGVDGAISAPEDIDEQQPLLAHLTKRKPLPPGNIKRLLSSTSNNKAQPSNQSRSQDEGQKAREINLNGITYREVNMAKVTYSVLAYSAARQGALVDRGANGGIAGEDVRIIAKTGRQVDIQGIDNHCINDIPIVTAGGIVNTQKGEVIAILHQYAYVGKGKTIHSCGQMEAYKQVVHDKSIKVGGKQRIETLDGYIIPLNIRHGLPYMTIRPYTDTEWETLPHVIMTADTDWNPSILDCEQEDNEEWFNAMEDLPSLTPDPLFDEYGDYRNIHIISQAIMTDLCLENAVLTDPTSLFQLYSQEIKPRQVDYERYQSKLAWLPLDIIKKTFEATTQFYRTPMGTHLKKRYKSPFPACNVNRRSEPVATDTVYADTPALGNGATAAQFFVGTDSLVCDVYPLKTDKQFVNVLLDNIRRRGAMTKLISDRAQVEISNKVQDILRNLMIADWQSEPHQQQQNPAERRYQDVKRMTNTLLDRTGAPPSLWLLAMTYTCFVLNHTANGSIGYAIPLTVLTGITQDISPLLQFEWYEPVYYREEESEFPSKSRESFGWFVGIAEHVGHALTYMILTKDTNKILYRSVVCTATNQATQNLRAENTDKSEPYQHVRSTIDDKIEALDDGETTGTVHMPIVHPEELIGRTFKITGDNEQLQHVKIVEALEEHECFTHEHPLNIQFKCSINDDQYEEIMSYNQIMDHLNKDDDNPVVWKFKDIIAHQGPLNKSHKDYKGSTYNLTIEWENGEITDEPLSIIAADDPVSCAIYGRKHNLLHLPGWKRFRGIAKRQAKLYREANLAKLRSFSSTPRFKYGYEIPKSYSHAIKLDQRNGNTKWADATKLELELMNSYNVFEDHGLNTDPPKGYKKIRVHLIYDVKHDGRHKARLVADGHLTDLPSESVYSGVVSLRGLHIFLFIAELNCLPVWATDVGSAYLEAFTNEKVCIIAGPEFGELEGHLLLISRALYGLRSSGARWHDRLADVLRKEGFSPCIAETDIWMRRNGELYEYIAVYVDDLAFAMKDPAPFVETLKSKYGFKIKEATLLKCYLEVDFFKIRKKSFAWHSRSL